MQVLLCSNHVVLLFTMHPACTLSKMLPVAKGQLAWQRQLDYLSQVDETMPAALLWSHHRSNLAKACQIRFTHCLFLLPMILPSNAV